MVDIPIIGIPTSVGYGYGEKGCAFGILAEAYSAGTLNASIYSNTITATSGTGSAFGISAVAFSAGTVKGHVDWNTGTVTGKAPGSKTIDTTTAPDLIVGSNSIKLINN